MYNLRGRDPEGGRVKYTISGDFFSVDGDTGAVRLREPLDREATEAIDVVITIQEPDSIEKQPPEKSHEKPLEKSSEISYTGKTPKLGSLDMSQNQIGISSGFPSDF